MKQKYLFIILGTAGLLLYIYYIIYISILMAKHLNVSTIKFILEHMLSVGNFITLAGFLIVLIGGIINKNLVAAAGGVISIMILLLDTMMVGYADTIVSILLLLSSAVIVLGLLGKKLKLK